METIRVSRIPSTKPIEQNSRNIRIKILPLTFECHFIVSQKAVRKRPPVVSEPVSELPLTHFGHSRLGSPTSCIQMATFTRYFGARAKSLVPFLGRVAHSVANTAGTGRVVVDGTAAVQVPVANLTRGFASSAVSTTASTLAHGK